MGKHERSITIEPISPGASRSRTARPHPQAASPANASRAKVSRSRLALMGGIFAVVFAVISGRLISVSAFPTVTVRPAPVLVSEKMPRPDIVDRNGRILAKDLGTASLFADARKIIDVDEAVELLSDVLGDVPRKTLRRKLMSRRAFVWLKRGMRPREQLAVHRLGLPGLGFKHENRRVYPNGQVAAHILGAVDLDNHGIAGIERYLDKVRKSSDTLAKSLAPLTLSVDLRAQFAVREELTAAMETFKAKAAAAVVLDVHTGEVLAMTSLPDFDPNQPAQALRKDAINRMTAGLYEMGSVFKAITVAMALDEGVATLESRYDARQPIRYASFKISDFHAKRRILTLPEVFIYSSNVGAAKMALSVGKKRQKAFLKRLGLLDRLRTELPESRQPQYPKTWRPLNVMTISFGHGLSVAPLQLASAAAALVNGGKLITPTFLRRSEAAAFVMAKQVLNPETSKKLRYLMRLNVTDGSGKKADVPGYRIGGKTGTAEKATKRGYSKNRLLTSFLSTFPTDNPRFVVLVMLDEPKGSKATHGYATAGWNAAPVTGRIIRRIAPLLGVLPESGQRLRVFEEQPVLVGYKKELR